jgi:hypothetical protein
MARLGWLLRDDGEGGGWVVCDEDGGRPYAYITLERFEPGLPAGFVVPLSWVRMVMPEATRWIVRDGNGRALECFATLRDALESICPTNGAVSAA